MFKMELLATEGAEAIQLPKDIDERIEKLTQKVRKYRRKKNKQEKLRKVNWLDVDDAVRL